MTRKLINRRTAGALTAALALGTAGPAIAAAGPAGARTFEVGPHGSVVQPGNVPHYQKANVLPPFTGATVPHYGKANVLPPFVPRHMRGFPETTAAPVVTATPRAVINHAAPGGSPDVVYILVGGLAGVAAGIGGAHVVSRRRSTGDGGTTAPPRSRTAV
jgi:hypothetical protein